MWMVDLFYQTMQDIYLDTDFHNFLVLTVITSSSIISVLGALKHIYAYVHRNGAGDKKRIQMCQNFSQTTPSSAYCSDSIAGTHAQSQSLWTSQVTNCDIKTVLFSEEIARGPGSRKRSRNLRCLCCDQEMWERYCSHGLCDSCCEKQGWCSSNNQHSAQPHNYSPRNSWATSGSQSIDLSNQSLKEVPVRLGFHCMKATSLSMSRNKLSHLPEHMALIRQLARIDLSHNLLSNIPAFFCTFHQLTSLNLRHNVLHQFPGAILDLSNLHVLLLDHNNLKLIPDELVRLQFLQELGLGNNLLTDIPPSLFNIRSLKIVRLSRNRGLQYLPSEIRKSICLEVLDLSDCGLQFLPSSLGQCSMLRQLKLNSNRLLWLPCEISQCCCLTTLDVSHNPLASLPATLLYRGASCFLRAQFCNFQRKEGTESKWRLMDRVLSCKQRQDFPSLTWLARACIKQHDLDLRPLPTPLSEKIMTCSICFFCGHKNKECSFRAVRHCLYPSNDMEFPFMFTFCHQHLRPESQGDLTEQLDALCHLNGTKHCGLTDSFL